ncbi:palmitoyl-protein thioesterase 1 isoform X2 [Daktulosphaira vitifoliae]|uniref:palmitoyl-protein thioesterase 1 isoform X2 n=1 Tax=Daktulosphaira vitifoliae TaxID=58002 RepID=UPI0021A9DB10|nr:palmitoyl-protein thioesterase 1 isoform X2 [Daktulosphaira vitifoliae]
MFSDNIYSLIFLFQFQKLIEVHALENLSTPIVLWHGMGDSCCNPLSLGRIVKVLKKELGSNTYVKSLKIGKSIEQDIANGFFKNVNVQVKDVCNQISTDPYLQNGYNAIGFSQGAQFLRAVAQRCPNPPMINLISIGGQHQGVFGMPRCLYQNHKWCEYVRQLLNKDAYVSWIQDSFVQAEYWHDPIKENDYISRSYFLADINNERTNNKIYRDNLLKLKNFVLIMFANDTMVIPKESSWFAFYSPGQDIKIMPLEQSTLYLLDRIGLKELEETGRLHFLAIPGDHLKFTEDWFINSCFSLAIMCKII